MRFFAAILIFLFSIAPVAHAAQETKLRLRAPSDDLREKQVMAYLEDQKILVGDLPFTVANLDLNNDGIDEWIFRQETTSNCTATASCKFLVAGLDKNKKPLLIAQIDAARINIRDDEMYGVRDLSVYKNPNNDLEASRYSWTPQQSTYLPF